MTTIEMAPNGVESVKVIPEQGHLRVQIQYRALGEGAAESIALDLVVPGGDRLVSELEYECVTRAMWLLDQYLEWKNRQTERARAAEDSKETTASLPQPGEKRRHSQ